MRLAWFGLLALSVSAAACGHSSGPSTVQVTCGGSTVLAGAKYVNVIVDPNAKTTVLTFPDPLNDDRTGTIPVDRKCTVGVTTDR